MPYDISKFKLESDLPLDPNYIAGFVAADVHSLFKDLHLKLNDLIMMLPSL